MKLWRGAQIRLWGCLAGCDYSKNIEGVGIKKAHKIVLEKRTFKRIAAYLRVLYPYGNGSGIDAYLDDLYR